MRSASAPAIASHILSTTKPAPLLHSHIAFIQSGKLAGVLKLMAGAEMIADKLPFVPARTKGVSIAVRALSGGLAGAAISKDKRSR